MSTPNDKPFYSYLVSPYAPKWARDEAIRAEASLMTVDDHLDWKPHEDSAADHDEKIFQEVEHSLRDMIAAKHGGQPPKPVRLSEVSKLAEQQIAREKEELKAGGHAEELVIDGLRVPPSLVPRSLDPSPVPEPWPRPRTKVRNRAVPLFVRFGLATAGAATVAFVVVQDIPSVLSEKFSDLAANAAGVFSQGTASSMPERGAEIAKEQERVSAQQRAAFASAAPADLPRNQLAAKGDNLVLPAPQAKRENVITNWSEIRSEPAIWLGPAGRAPTRESATTGSAPRPVPAEEIAMLRKQGDQYIAAGDFVGARTVLERAADAGDHSAALALAATYDPVVLARFKVKGLTPDIVRAGFWYERARDLGSPEAPRRLEAMVRGN